MKNTQSRLFGYIFRNKKTSLLFRILTVILFIILAAAFAVSITYSMIMEENFYKRTGNGIRKEYSKNFLVVMYQTSDDFLQKFREGIYKKAEEKHIRIDFINVESINPECAISALPCCFLTLLPLHYKNG
jgi:ABC-type sugar transport system substrate-binding protein